MPPPKSEELSVEERRNIVAANLLAGQTYRVIAQALGVGIGTIARDVKVITQRWQREQVKDIDRLRSVDLRRLDIVINTLFDRVQQGELPAIDRLLAVVDRRAKLLGLDARQKLDLTTGDQPISNLIGDILTLITSAGDKPLPILEGLRAELAEMYNAQHKTLTAPEGDSDG